MIKCKSCNATISPEWVHCISKGECPGCGSGLFSDKDRELLQELSKAMQEMPNNPEGIAGWLISNYKFEKIGDAKPTTKFHEKISEKQTEQVKMHDNPVQKFLKNAGVADGLAERKAKLANLAKQIKSGQVDAEQYEDGPDADYDEESEEEYAPAVRESRALVNNTIGAQASDMSADELRGLVESVSSAPIARDLDDSKNQVLQMQRLKRLQRQREVAEGGGGGSFRRSS